MANEKQIENLVGLLDGYAEKGGHHLNKEQQDDVITRTFHASL